VTFLLALGFGWLIYRHASPFAAGSDSSGYLNSARLLARGEFTVRPRAIAGLEPSNFDYQIFQPLGFVADRDTGRMAPTYPIGLPLHLMVAAQIVGWEKTARVVNALNVLALGALLFAFGRALGLRRGWALAGVALLWASPVLLYHAVQPLSDPLATTWSLAAIYFGWRAREHRDWRWALAAGIAFAVGVLVRPTNLLLGLPLLIALGGNWRHWLACAAGGAPGALLLGYYNYRTYGSPLTTGYGYLGDAFDVHLLGPTLWHYAKWIPALVGLPVALAALTLPWTHRREPRVIALMASWLGVLVAFYCTYYCAAETWWYLRFLLPAFPAVILGGLLAGQSLASSWAARTRRWLPLACFALSLGQLVALTRHFDFFFLIRDWERDYYLGARWAREHLPADAVVVTFQFSGALYYYTDLAIARSDYMSPRDFFTLAQAAIKARRPVYALLRPDEVAEVFAHRVTGKWEPLDTGGKARAWRLVEPPATPPPLLPR
jgi:hypothetical protein